MLRQGQDVQSRVEQGRQSIGWGGPAWSGSLRDAVKAAGQSVVQSGQECHYCPVCQNSSPSPGLAGLFTSPAHQLSARSHCPSGCPQQTGPEAEGRPHVAPHPRALWAPPPTSSLPSWGPLGQARAVSNYGNGSSVAIDNSH